MKRSLRFDDLAERHPLDPAQLDSCANAAKVRLHAHHQPPVDFQMLSQGRAQVLEVQWTPPTPLLLRSYANSDDAKRDGAYAMALAAVEELDSLVGIARTETKSGADYFVAKKGSDPEDLEEALRLEVSGTDGDETQIRYRLKQKQQQTRDGNRDEPAIAAVVGFKAKLILVEPVES